MEGSFWDSSMVLHVAVCLLLFIVVQFYIVWVHYHLLALRVLMDIRVVSSLGLLVIKFVLILVIGENI